jgi:hypothetical protein
MAARLVMQWMLLVVFIAAIFLTSTELRINRTSLQSRKTISKNEEASREETASVDGTIFGRIENDLFRVQSAKNESPARDRIVILNMHSGPPEYVDCK